MAPSATLESTLKVALDELRMQMLGAQILFGFQFEAVFQDRFESLSVISRWIAAIGLLLMVVTIAVLIAGPAYHRLAERGQTTVRMHSVATAMAALATMPFSLALGCAVFVVFVGLVSPFVATSAGLSATAVGLGFWYVLGLALREERRSISVMKQPGELHSRIDQMLTEARVILPGAQALLGFQFIAMLTKKFEALPSAIQHVHFGALAAVLLCVMLLIAPATAHRLAFNGQDSVRFYKVGSVLVTVALFPLAVGITGDVYVALALMVGGVTPALGAAATFVLFCSGWYAVPLLARGLRGPVE